MSPAAVASAIAAKEKGNQAFKLSDYPLAIAHYTTSISLDPSGYSYPLNRAACYLKLEQWKEAEKDCTTSLKLQPGNNVKALYRRGLARKGMGNWEGAREDFEEAKEQGAGVEVTKELEKLGLGTRDRSSPEIPFAPASITTIPDPPTPTVPTVEKRQSPSAARLRAAISPDSDSNSPSNGLMKEVSTTRLSPSSSSSTPNAFAAKREKREERISSSPIAIASSAPSIPTPPPSATSKSKPSPFAISDVARRPMVLPGSEVTSSKKSFQCGIPAFEPFNQNAMKTPVTATAFESSWNAYPSARLSLLKSLDPSNLRSLFGASLTPDLLSDIILALPSSSSLEEEWIQSLLFGLTKVERFSTVVGFLDEAEKNVVREVVRKAKESLDQLAGQWDV